MVKEVLFLGSKEIGSYCLQLLINLPQVKIVGVLSNDRQLKSAGKTVTQIAGEHHIPVFSHPDDMPEADFLISVQYHLILKSDHLKKARRAAVNLHLAPLPEYRGCNQFSFAILDEKTEFGTTLHLMDEGIDSGDLLFERRFPIPDKCTVTQLYELTLDHSKTLFAESITKILNGNFKAVAQKELIPERGSVVHYRKEMEALKNIDAGLPLKEIEKRIRATYFPPFPPPYTVIDGKKVNLDDRWKQKLKKLGLL